MRVQSFVPFEISEEFFFSWDALYDVEGTRRKEAIGHQILLSTSDIGLQLAMLTEGTTIDFLFGSAASTPSSTGKTRDAMKNVKNYIRELKVGKQEAVVEFYAVIYASILNFIVKCDGCGMLCDCIPYIYAKSTLRMDVLEAFQKLYRILYDIRHSTQGTIDTAIPT